MSKVRVINTKYVRHKTIKLNSVCAKAVLAMYDKAKKVGVSNAELKKVLPELYSGDKTPRNSGDR